MITNDKGQQDFFFVVVAMIVVNDDDDDDNKQTKLTEMIKTDNLSNNKRFTCEN